MSVTYTVALAGNPNVGKSTLFNALTGAQQHVGNWPGKTVERKAGLTRLPDRNIAVVDLPGTYSLTANSVEEIIARDFIIEDAPDAVVAVLDASNLERNLYLVVQLLELETPLILVLNMSDLARQRGLKIDSNVISARLGGVPVIESVGSKNVGIEALKRAIHELSLQPRPASATRINYGPSLEREIHTLQDRITAKQLDLPYPVRWLAIKLLENDPAVTEKLTTAGATDLLTAVEQATARIAAECDGDDPETLLVDQRYIFITDLTHQAVIRPENPPETFSDRVDRIVTHRIWGLPIFLLLMWVVFQFTANVSAPFLDFTDGLIAGPVTNLATRLLDLLTLTETWVGALVIDGIIAGVGGVLVFIPVLISMYLAIALLEDSGYMARAAFVMDRVMRVLGLHGKSFLPMLVGFGCTVPAVYATRTLENEHDRKLTAFLATFMSCGARLPVYVLFGAAFFGAAGGTLVFAMYLLGILIALLTGFAFKQIVYKNKPPQPFVMELPAYRLPNFKVVLRQTWDRVTSFLQNAGTVILVASMAIWLLMAIPARPGVGSFNAVRAEDSLYGVTARLIAPVFAPAGFGDWQSASALITGFVAKEVVITTMNQVYIEEDTSAAAAAEAAEPLPSLTDDLAYTATSLWEATLLTTQEILNIAPRTLNLIPGLNVPEFAFLPSGEEESFTRLETVLRSNFSPLAAVAFNVFILLYVPCMAATGAMKHEFGPRWMSYQIAYTFTIAWVAATLVYQLGRLFGLA